MKLTLKYSTIIEQGLFLLIFALVFLYDAFSGTLGFLDELAGMFSFFVILYYFGIKERVKLYRQEYYILILLLIVMIVGLLSNFYANQKGFHTDAIAIFGDFINFFKAFVAYFGVRLLSNNFSSSKVLKKTSKYNLLIFYILVVVVILDIVIGFYPHPSRYGIFSLQLFFQHPSRFGFAFIFIFLSLLPKYYTKNKKLLFFVLTIGVLSFRVKYFGFVLVAIFFMFFGKRLLKIPKAYFIATLGILGLISIWLFWDWLYMYFSFESIKTGWSRAVILYYSFNIGKDFFPLGTGFGTYSSYYSGLHYSWVYDYYGISNVFGMSRDYWGFLADQYWPMVLGEFGYLGLIATLGVIIKFLNLFIQMAKQNINNNKYYFYLSSILGLLMLLIDSTSDAIFTQQRAVVIFMFFALIVNLNNEKDEVK